MVTRHFIFAALCATASLAQAGPMDSAASVAGPAVTVTQMDKVSAMLRNSPDAAGEWRMNESDTTGRAGAAAVIYTAVGQGGAWRGPDAPYLAMKAQGGPLAAGVPKGLSEAPVTTSNGPVRSSAVDVPEPATGMLLLAGLLGATVARRRRK